MHTDFAIIPETTLPNGQVVKEFQLARVLSTVVDGKATIQFDAKPTVNINYFRAGEAAQAAGFQLITETQHAAVRQVLIGVDANWTGGKVGEGNLRQGLRNGTVDEAVSNDYEPEDQDEDRKFYLPDGSIYYDAAGHIYSWVRDDVQGNEKGIVARRFAEDSISIALPYENGTKGIGYCWADFGDDWSGGALIRGGCWYSDDSAGLFALGRWGPPDWGGGVGFRCTKSLG